MSYEGSTWAEVHQCADRVLQHVLLREKVTPPCCRGCFHCCREPVLCARAEAAFMLETFSYGELEALKEKVKAWHEAFLLSDLNLVNSTAPSAHTYRRLNLWCPLLKDGECSAYGRRPSSCRMHVAKASAAGCIDDALRKKQEYILIPQLDTTLLLKTVEKLQPGEVEVFDHLGVHLYNLLFGFDLATRARMEISADGDTMTIKKFNDEHPGN